MIWHPSDELPIPATLFMPLHYTRIALVCFFTKRLTSKLPKGLMLTTLVLSISISLLCFLGDLTVWGLYHVPLLFLSRSLLYVVLCTGIPFGWAAMAGLFVLLQSFIFQGTLGADLIIMIPLAMAVYYVRRIIDLNFISEMGLVYMCLLINALVIDPGILRYSFTQIILALAPLHFIFALCMLYLVRGSQGNRS